MRGISIALLGLGNVGAGALKILRENRVEIEGRLAASVNVKAVLVRDLDKPRQVEIDPERLTTKIEDILDDPDVRVVVELIGGIEPARSWILDALARGKHVVTANKALLAEHGAEIFAAANKAGVQVFFEGSVAGGIPVLRALREGLASDRITRVVGIVNGTSNYILDSMTRRGIDYDEALAQAQAAGFAEADPTLDVEGGDAAHKLALLALVSFGLRVDPNAIDTTGITGVRPFDIRMADELGYVIKSLAIVEMDDQGRPALRVHPAFVPRGHILAGVHGAYNAVQVESVAMGRSLYYGKGAGMMPTGMAVVSDIVEVCRAIISFTESGPPAEAFQEIKAVEPASLDEQECENYLCVHVPNVPGVLGRVASCLGEHGVSIQRMNQDTPNEGEVVDMVIISEKVSEVKLRKALAALDEFPDTVGTTDRIRIHPPEVID
jgi:homoserine dehydrogenase